MTNLQWQLSLIISFASVWDILAKFLIAGTVHNCSSAQPQGLTHWIRCAIWNEWARYTYNSIKMYVFYRAALSLCLKKSRKRFLCEHLDGWSVWRRELSIADPLLFTVTATGDYSTCLNTIKNHVGVNKSLQETVSALLSISISILLSIPIPLKDIIVYMNVNMHCQYHLTPI